MFDNFLKSIDFIQRLHTIIQKKRSILLISFALILLFLFFFFRKIDLSQQDFVNIIPNLPYIRNLFILFALIEIGILVIWFIIRRIPKFKVNELGFLLAIKTEDDKAKIRIKHDFIQQLKSEMENIGINVNIKYLSEYHCEYLFDNKDKKSISKYHYKSRAKLIIYGYADIRQQDGEDCYYLKLNESVTHEPIPTLESKKISGEMILSFPSETIIQIKNEIFGFKLTGKLFGIAAKYILGITCIYSRNVKKALQFHLGLIKSFEQSLNQIPNLKNVVENTKKTIYEESMFLAKEAFINLKDINKMEEYLKLGIQYYETAWYYLLLAIFYFEKNRDMTNALGAIEKAKNLDRKDFTWSYSKGFLLAYNGDLRKAYNNYKIGFRNLTAPTTHIECELFIRDILEKEPENFQLHYCLGLIYYFAHEDDELAKESFLIFKEKSIKENKFTEQIKYIDKYLNDIEKRGC